MNSIAIIIFVLYYSSLAHAGTNGREYSDWINYKDNSSPTKIPTTRLPDTKPLIKAITYKFDENRSRFALDYLINRLLSALPAETEPKNTDNANNGRISSGDGISAPEVDKSVHVNLIFLNDNLLNISNSRDEENSNPSRLDQRFGYL